MGVALGAVSIQNEPDGLPRIYESCGWTADNIHDFLGILKEEFAKKGVTSSILVVAPEAMNFKEGLIASTLNDGAIADVVGSVGVHPYDKGSSNFGAQNLPTVKDAGKRLWVTEVSDGDADDPSLATAFTGPK